VELRTRPLEVQAVCRQPTRRLRDTHAGTGGGAPVSVLHIGKYAVASRTVIGAAARARATAGTAPATVFPTRRSAAATAPITALRHVCSPLYTGGEYQCRRGGELYLFSPEMVFKLHPQPPVRELHGVHHPGRRPLVLTTYRSNWHKSVSSYAHPPPGSASRLTIPGSGPPAHASCLSACAAVLVGLVQDRKEA